MLLAFIMYAAFAALVHELIVGLAAMHSGWFPAFAVALITLVIGMLIGVGRPPPRFGVGVGTNLLRLVRSSMARKFADPFGDRRDDTKPVRYCLVGREDMYDLADPVVAEAGILGLAVPNAPAQALDLLKDRCLGMLPVIPG
jgi:hypothetical protein